MIKTKSKIYAFGSKNKIYITLNLFEECVSEAKIYATGHQVGMAALLVFCEALCSVLSGFHKTALFRRGVCCGCLAAGLAFDLVGLGARRVAGWFTGYFVPFDMLWYLLA